MADIKETPLDEARRKELEGLTADLARVVGIHVPKGYVFALILSSADDGGVRVPGALAYCSSAQRQDMPGLLRDMASRLESDAGRPS